MLKLITNKQKLYVIMAKILGNLSSNSTNGEIKVHSAISAISNENLNLLRNYEPSSS